MKSHGKTVLSITLKIAGWTVHLLGVMVIAASLFICARCWQLGPPPGPAEVAFEHFQNQQLRMLWYAHDGQVVYFWGVLRENRLPRNAERRRQTILSWGTDYRGRTGTMLHVVKVWKDAPNPGEPPLSEHTELSFHWTLPALVGLAIMLLPLVIPPSRASLLHAYGRIILPLVRRRRRIPGFEVVPPPPPAS